MRFHIAEPRPARTAHGIERTDLIDHVCGDLTRRRSEIPPPESHEVRIPGMRSDRDSMTRSRRHGLAHRHRIARVKPARDVRGREQRHERCIGTKPVRPKPFAKVGVQIDGVFDVSCLLLLSALRRRWHRRHQIPSPNGVHWRPTHHDAQAEQ
jgi:hypothetical protein